MSSHRWQIIVLLMGYAALGHFNRMGISVVGDEVFIPGEIINEENMGWVYSAFLIVYAAFMLPAGWLIDRIGSGRALLYFGLGMGFFVSLTGVVGWVTTDPIQIWIALLVIRGIAGSFNSPLHPGAAHVVSDVIPAESRGAANGMVTAGALIGIAFYPLLCGWLISTFSWQTALFVSGVTLMGYAGLWRVFGMPFLPRPNHNEEPAADLKSDWTAVRALLTSRNAWLIALSYAAYGYFQYLFFYWMGHYFKNELKIPVDESRWAQFWIYLAMGAGMAIGGLSMDAVCRRLGTMVGRRTIVLVGMGLGALFPVIAVNLSDFTAVTVCLAVSLGAAGMVEGVFWTTATDIGGQSRGLSGAFMNTSGNIGGFISPVATPVLASLIGLGYSGAIVVACVVSVIGALLWFGINVEPVRRSWTMRTSIRRESDSE